MKKKLKILICNCIAITSSIITLQAQDIALAKSKIINDPVQNNSYAIGNINSMKPATNVDARVLKAFNNEYKNTANVTWFTVNKEYIALFDWNGLKAHAVLGKKGQTVYSVRSESEKNLPTDARNVIKSNYVDYTIGNVSEVNSEGHNTFIVNLENNDNLIIVRVENGILEEVAHYQTHATKTLHKKAHIIIPAQ